MPKGTGARTIATRACKICGEKITGVPADMANHTRYAHKGKARAIPQADSIDSLLEDPSRFLAVIHARIAKEGKQIEVAKDAIASCTQRILQLEGLQDALQLETTVVAQEFHKNVA